MSMFNKAKTIAPAPKAKLGKPAKAEVEIAGIEHLAMIDTLQKTLETVRATLESEVKSAAAERFIAHIKATGQKPDNFTGVEGNGFASLQFRRKSSAYALSEEAVALLRENGIEPHKEVTTPALFAINPAYASDQDLLAKVEKALTKIVPEDFIVQQEEQSKLTATEETLNTAISKRGRSLWPGRPEKAVAVVSHATTRSAPAGRFADCLICSLTVSLTAGVSIKPSTKCRMLCMSVFLSLSPQLMVVSAEGHAPSSSRAAMT